MAYAYANLGSPPASAQFATGPLASPFASYAAPSYAAPYAAAATTYAAPPAAAAVTTYAAPPASFSAPLKARTRSIHSRDADRGFDMQTVQAAARKVSDATENVSFRKMVYFIYLLAAGMVAYSVCLFVYAGPLAFDIAHVAGTLVLLCALFLFGNATLFSSMLRMQHEIGNFKRHNAAFEDDIKQQAKTINELQKAASAFKEIDWSFGSSVEQAAKQVDDLRRSTRTGIAANCKQLCRLYTDKSGKSRFLETGEELDNTFQLFEVAFSGVVPNYAERIGALRKALRESDDFKAKGGVDVSLLCKLMEAAVTEEDLEEVAGALEDVLEDHS